MAAFYYCKTCGNMFETIYDSKNTPICCGHEMERLTPESTDGAHEKHVPVCSKTGNVLTVRVGQDPHPMNDAHYIQWIGVCTNMGYHRRDLLPDESPCAEFCLLEKEIVEKIFAYCNIHGLWMAK